MDGLGASAGGEAVWGSAAAVAEASPALDHDAGCSEGIEDLAIEKLITEAGI
jgi:hypothetical protein